MNEHTLYELNKKNLNIYLISSDKKGKSKISHLFSGPNGNDELVDKLKTYFSNQKYEPKDFNRKGSEPIEVDFLGPGVKGMYIPSTDTIYLVKSLLANEKEFVKNHEETHRESAYTGRNQDEALTDILAQAKNGGANPIGARHGHYTQKPTVKLIPLENLIINLNDKYLPKISNTYNNFKKAA